LFLGDIFKEKQTKTNAVTSAKHTAPVVDIFDDPLNASDI